MERPMYKGLKFHRLTDLPIPANYQKAVEIAEKYDCNLPNKSINELIELDEVCKTLTCEGLAEESREKYKNKVNELKKCYKQASLITGQYFYLPIQREDDWIITFFNNGDESQLSWEEFCEFIEQEPADI